MDRGRVGEAGHAVFHERDVLALDPQGREARAGEEGVEPAFTPADFAPDGGIAFGEAESAGEESRLNHPVGNGGIYSGPEAGSSAGRGAAAHGLLGIGKLPSGVGGLRGENEGAGAGEAEHGARVVAVDPDMSLICAEGHAEAPAPFEEAAGEAAIGEREKDVVLHLQGRLQVVAKKNRYDVKRGEQQCRFLTESNPSSLRFPWP